MVNASWYLSNSVDTACNMHVTGWTCIACFFKIEFYDSRFKNKNFILRTDDTNKLFSQIMKTITKVLFILIKWIILTTQILFFHKIFQKIADTVTKICMDIYDYGSYRLPNLEKGLTAGVIDQQGMLTPPWHLIPPLIYSEVRVRPFSDLYFL
jgi:hypothetical protein